MFKELAPLVRHRAILFTVSHVEEDQFRVNVIPKKITDAEDDALTTPVSLTGTVEDLDRDLPQTLLHFVSSHLELKNTLERAKADIDAASKAARTEAREQSGSQVRRKDQTGSPANSAACAPEIPALVKSEPPKAASLFDPAPEPAAPFVATTPAAANTETASGQSDLDEDEEVLRESDLQGEVEDTDEAA